MPPKRQKTAAIAAATTSRPTPPHNNTKHPHDSDSHSTPELLLAFDELLGTLLHELGARGHRIVAVEVQADVGLLAVGLVEAVAQFLDVHGNAVDVDGEVHDLPVLPGEAEVLLGSLGAGGGA